MAKNVLFKANTTKPRITIAKENLSCVIDLRTISR
jgi:hypothetical protein